MKHKMDWSQTLNLPKTDFPMRANLAQREPQFLRFWEENDIFKKMLKKNRNNKKFILHDGPPYANGDIHLGHALNKVLKDIVNKYKSLQGYYTPYIPGWDTHGLPIEQQVIKKLGVNRHEVDPVEFRKKCKEFALSYIDIQRQQFKRLGVFGEWEDPYMTLDPKFEARQIRVFGEMAKKGYIYKGLKPVYWCPSCETALAEAEIEYQEDKTYSIYVKFEVIDDKGLFANLNLSGKKVYIVIWTTTTWTLPGNLAIALNTDFDYSLVDVGNEILIVASELVERVMKTNKIDQYHEIARFKGKDLEYVKCKHPFLDRTSLVILGEHVTLEAGTGCVHTAPGHGEEDFEVCERYNIPVIVPVDNKGYLTQEAGKFAGLFYEDSNKEIAKELEASDHLLGVEKITHQYPHCWRCKNPVIFRATEQWFASVKGFREEALKAVDDVKWVPEWGRDRIYNMIADRQDWCISRQRIWGVPIPIFYCKNCRKELITDETIDHIAKIFEKEGSDAWFSKDVKELLPEGTKCPVCGCMEFEKETDIMDVWFDSGSSHAYVLESREDLEWPCDMYLEGNDQYRGWFQSSLLTAVATKGRAPYRIVLTHGFVVDGEGKKMSKSEGNVISPFDIINEFGADILRLWCVSADYTTDMRISKDIIKQLTEIYRKIRNTARFLLGNLYDFNPKTDKVGCENLKEIDKWALQRLYKLIEKVTKAYEEYDYNQVYHLVHNFCVIDMSNLYLDINKDRLYASKSESLDRRSAQTVMYEILVALTKLIAPILSFTAEEIWQNIIFKEEDAESVFLTSWPKVNENILKDETLEEKWNKIIEIKDIVAKQLEIARNEKLIGSSLDSKVKIFAKGNIKRFIEENKDIIQEVLIVSQLEVEEGDSDQIKVEVYKADGLKCERCWKFDTMVGKNEENLNVCPRCYEVVKVK